MSKSKFVEANEKIAEKVVGAHKKVEGAVTGAYKRVEETVVGGYKKIEDAFVDRFLARYGETTDEAKKRLHEEQKQLKQEKSYATNKDNK